MRLNTSSDLNFSGKFVSNNINKKNLEILNKFKNYKFEGKTNANYLKFKPYNIYVKEDADAKKLVFSSSFKEPFNSNITDCFISNFNTDEAQLESATKSFRASLSWFEDYKKKFNGHNNLLEEIVAYIREITL